MKYILVTGGVISGVGKGVIASSFGTLLKSCQLDVTSIKIDPYINIDAGTFSPYEHGEVYVLDDGAEVDLDLGNYERFLDITLHRDNNITTGKIYKLVIEKERTGEYLGKTVQVVPHITDAIQEWVERVAQTPVQGSSKPQVCIIELGGTIGDIEGMPFVEAFRQFQFRVKRENFCVAHVSLVPLPKATGEPKTKPTQSSVRELRGCGLSPDLIVCRSEKPIGLEVKEKISNFCHVGPDQVICIHDLNSIYHVPLLMEQNGVIEYLNERLQLNIDMSKRTKCLQHWRDLARRTETVRREVSIAIVGKYTKFADSYASVVKALQHAALAANRKLVLVFIESCQLEQETLVSEPSKYHKEWQRLCDSDGILVPGGFGSRGMEGKIRACRWARENQKPMLGICLGLQAAVIEFARNKLGLKDANTTEIDPQTGNALVIDMPEHHTGQLGGTMRLGKRTTVFSEGCTSIIRQLYGNPKSIEERHRHRYEVNPKYVPQLEEHGMRFVATDVDKTRMEIIELRDHPYFVATQYHPEYLSRPLKPSPPFLGLILASVDRLPQYIQRGCRLSPRQLSDASSDEEETYVGATKLMKSLQITGTTTPTNGISRNACRSSNSSTISTVSSDIEGACGGVGVGPTTTNGHGEDIGKE
ncbi:CTP synthase isoform X1 [Drosophila pseudoobscura]|uniref:CTP synthase n=2 Tax=Drosophila pseudoobscura pseudoobscura TaxID=46245 RepID=PYRG_DROPS|nr:CTP synthase isoform X1 [Drosophila pseudoobscura]Q2M197.2 RecName: Full=CTP synthase; AltName: Full=CTP synthetase; AltName: Full=UTP--ammonia ligase [Drosophila pseudoobscura pseudoobscura]